MFHAPFSLQCFFFLSSFAFSHTEIRIERFYFTVIFCERKQFSNVVFRRFSVHILEIICGRIEPVCQAESAERTWNEYSCSFRACNVCYANVYYFIRTISISHSQYINFSLKKGRHGKWAEIRTREERKRHARTRPKIEQIYLIIVKR